MLRKIMPARAQAAQPQADDDVLCDLDAIIDRRATVILGGQAHVLEPITTELFCAFWQKVIDFKKIAEADPAVHNEAYHAAVSLACPSITLEQTRRLTLVQKGRLIEAIAAKVIGDRHLFEHGSEKKK